MPHPRLAYRPLLPSPLPLPGPSPTLPHFRSVRRPIFQDRMLRLREGRHLSFVILSTNSFLPPPFPACWLFPTLSWLFLSLVFLFSLTFSHHLFCFYWYFLFSLCCVQAMCGCVSALIWQSALGCTSMSSLVGLWQWVLWGGQGHGILPRDLGTEGPVTGASKGIPEQGLRDGAPWLPSRWTHCSPLPPVVQSLPGWHRPGPSGGQLPPASAATPFPGKPRIEHTQ